MDLGFQLRVWKSWLLHPPPQDAQKRQYTEIGTGPQEQGRAGCRVTACLDSDGRPSHLAIGCWDPDGKLSPVAILHPIVLS